MSNFIHLHVHTHYSLLDGLSKPSNLLDYVKELNMDSVAITDHGNMYGAIEFYKAAIEKGIKPIIGCEVYITNDMMKRSIKDDNRIYHLTLLAADNKGYQNLIKIVSIANMGGFYYKPRIDFEVLKEHNAGLIVLSGCLGGQLSQLLLENKDKEAEDLAIKYKSEFGDRYYIELQKHPRNNDQNIVTPKLIDLARKIDMPVVATTDSHCLRKEDMPTQDILLSINTGKNLEDKKRLSLLDSDIYLATPDEMIENFKDIPEAIENTVKIAERCNVEIELGKYRLPEFSLPEEYDHDSYLEELCDESDRYEQKYSERLKYELGVIKKTGFASYLLIVWDIIKWAKDNNIMVGPGRGSAAGSLISYYLHITDIDPIKYGLFFERFMNPDRVSMPDIDIDFDDTKRNLVIDYVSKKYGRGNVVQISTFGTIFARSAIRDAGRVMKYDLQICDRLAKMIPFNSSLSDALNNIDKLKKEYEDPKIKRLIDMAIKLEGTVRHIGTHACGIVIADKPIVNYLPIQFSRDKSIVSQYDMRTIENLGLLKMDFLGLRNLSVISECQKLIKEQLGETININNIPLNDKNTIKLLQQAKTTSVFQLESKGMKKYLLQLKPSNIEEISTLIALYRPGPIELIPSYVERKFGHENISYLHPKLKDVLSSTYGIMIFQEQLMSAVKELAGFTLSEADTLRKAVGKKLKKLLSEQEIKFKQGCKNNDITKNVADGFWKLVEPFGGYGFNLAHSISYAMISYQTAYLKANYPIQFMVAEMNSDDNIERITELISELSDMGIKISHPDINISNTKFTNNKNTILFSLQTIKGMGEKVSDIIIKERKNGPYKSIEDFILRMHKGITKKTVELLAKSGAFDTFGLDRSQISEAAEEIIEYVKFEYKDLLPPLLLSPINSTKQQIKRWEKELLGLYL